MKHYLSQAHDAVEKVRVQIHRTAASISSQSSLTIFMYHSITENPTRNWGPWQYAITPTAFENHISTISDEYTVVSIDDVLSHISGGTTELPEDAAVITFDDGYNDTLTRGLPVLERYNVPATIYVATNLLGSQHGPFEYRLAEALINNCGHSSSISDLGAEFPPSIPDSPERAYKLLRQPTKWVSPQKRANILELFGNESASGIAMLNETDIKSICHHELITIGAHGHTHVPLTILSEDQIIDNITRCVAILESLVNHEIKHFSYPYGAHNADIDDAIQSTNIETSMTTGPGVIKTSNLKQERRFIPRIDGVRYPASSNISQLFSLS